MKVSDAETAAALVLAACHSLAVAPAKLFKHYVAQVIGLENKRPTETHRDCLCGDFLNLLHEYLRSLLMGSSLEIQLRC